MAYHAPLSAQTATLGYDVDRDTAEVESYRCSCGEWLDGDMTEAETAAHVAERHATVDHDLRLF